MSAPPEDTTGRRRWLARLLTWLSDRREPLPEHGNVALERLKAELRWYDRSARRKKFAYHTLGAAALAVSASIPVSAALGASAAALGILGAVAVIIQGTMQLFRLHEQWLSHRGAYERLISEEALYLSHAGPYKHCRSDTTRNVLLAERVEVARAAETGEWLKAEHLLEKSSSGSDKRAAGDGATGGDATRGRFGR